MSEEKKEPWLNYLALTTVILAVCATLSTFKGGSFSTRSVLSQTQAANQWAYYQAKGIKSYLYEIQKEKLELELVEHQEVSGLASHVLESQKKTIATYADRISKYNTEKAAIEKEAKRLEAIRDDAQKHAQVFGIAVIFLQIAILLSSVAALMKKKPVWYLGVLMGIIGIVYFADGFLLFFI
jgi:hypothetical protein